MLAKLSFRNAKRQAHDYIIYFVTLTAIFSLIHGLNSLLFAEDDIFPLDDSTFILPMILISSLLFSISLWLTSYMTNFILKRRSKEISIYITLGMEPYQISKVFTLENFYISIFALILSFLCGSFVYQVLKAVSFNLLGKPYALRVAIPLRFGKTSTPNFHSSQSSMTQLCFSSARKPGHHHHTLLFSLRSVPAFFKISTYLGSIETR